MALLITLILTTESLDRYKGVKTGQGEDSQESRKKICFIDKKQTAARLSRLRYAIDDL